MRFLVILSFILLMSFHLKDKAYVAQKELIIFHAGSLSVPMKQVAKEYEKMNPGTKVLLEAAGSLVCARKVTELKKPCDIVASADYFVIDKLLMPGYASWNIRFATNEMVIAYADRSNYSGKINSENWMDILQKKDVIYSRSDPDSDPCGYRAVLTFKLAEKYYKNPGLCDRMISKDSEYIRPKEVDLIALLESGAIDYMFQYKSVAVQHGFKYISLPKEINLSDPSENTLYSTVSTEVAANRPGTKMEVIGDYINYSITILDNAPQKDEAINFIDFMLGSEGIAIFRKNGQEPIVPAIGTPANKIPQKLMKYVTGTQKK